MILIAGRPLYRTTTHVVIDLETGRISSQHRSETAALGGLRLRRGSLNFNALAVMPIADALARVKE